MTVTETPPEAAPSPSVRERILDVAQALFAEQGYAATSTRAIAQAAGVNLAQLHYHYGAKRELFHAAYLRGASQVTEARTRTLAALKARHGAGPIPLEELVESFVTPFMLNGETPEGRATMRMHARLHTEPEDIGKELLSTVYDETTLAYLAEFQRVLPHVPHETLCWRLYFMMGAYRYTLLRTGRLEMMSGGACDSGDFRRAVAEIVPFLCAGLRAG
ncbi:TetR family transcriptional regulator [Siccirubricoccus sp. KC 17139]|uniref:TetR family transcriptional regulator n=1 Tax=Siccirubricoccus soli TaxID=2899147 RepID=A0ABT1D0M5_9PROT|nr:TetR/AcrR family transcriptional regulator [Siccirubricoccus soli]MCO6415464.1 TetR family transcriptional regulator [Siccirubricoccus soli]MCP2681596.1 TetR family transcriptional regulator [Siccirubricoccus soli]